MEISRRRVLCAMLRARPDAIVTGGTVATTAVPFETPRRFQLALNRIAARQLGLAIPREILFAADTVHD